MRYFKRHKWALALAGFCLLSVGSVFASEPDASSESDLPRWHVGALGGTSIVSSGPGARLSRLVSVGAEGAYLNIFGAEYQGVVDVLGSIKLHW